MLPFNLQQLRILKAVVIKKNFTTAANILYLSQPYISKQIKDLEKKLNIILFNRQNKKLILTVKGKLFFRYALRILNLCEESCRVLINVQKTQPIKLKIGVIEPVNKYVMPKLCAILVQHFTALNFNIEVTNSNLISHAILNQQFDFVITDEQIPKNIKKYLTIHFFAKDELIFIIAKSHPFSKKKLLKKTEFCNIKLFVLKSMSLIQQSIDKIFQEKYNENKLKSIIEFDSIESIKIALNLGLGIALVSKITVEREINLNEFELLQIENIHFQRNLFLIQNLKSYNTKIFNLFSNELTSIKN